MNLLQVRYPPQRQKKTNSSAMNGFPCRICESQMSQIQYDVSVP